jgi:O-antigen/teichoic acid export membrane protein
MIKIKLFNSVRNSSFLKGSLLLFAGSLIGNIAGYVYHIAVGRILGPEKYATICKRKRYSWRDY